MQAHEQRVVDEKAELDTKIAKLWEFIGGDVWRSLPWVEQRLLAIQHDQMTAYSTTLGTRIECFGSKT